MSTWKIVLLGVLLLGRTAVGQAQFTFTTNNGAITITGYAGTNGNAVIPDTINGYRVTGIGGFYASATSLTNITIPASVTNIASGVFLYQSSLTAILVDGQNPDYSSANGSLLNQNQTLLIQVPGGMAGSYTMPASVTSIGNAAFEECGNLTNIVIGTNVTSIGANTFNYCNGLSGIAIPGSVTNIGSGAFTDCQSLMAINVDQQNLYYASIDGILYDKPLMTLLQTPGGMAGSVAIPAGVTSIGTSAFASCTDVTNIVMPDSVTNIGSGAFAACTSLTILALSTNVTSIGDDAFYDCPGLTSLQIPNGVASIGYAAFEYCAGLTNIIIGTGVTTIGGDAFANCVHLTSLGIPSSVTNIAAASTSIVRIGIGFQIVNGPIEMVANCSRLTAITVDAQNPAYSSANGILFNKSQTALLEAPGAFAGNYAIPGSVNSVGAEAFQNCGGLTSMAIPGSVTNIGAAAFNACGSLAAITVNGQNPDYSSSNGILFDKTETTLIQFPGGLAGSYTVPNGITHLGSTAFSGCSNLTSLAIPASVTNVGSSTFASSPKAGIYFAGNAPGIISTAPAGGIILSGGILIPGNNFYHPNSEAIYYLPGTTGWSATFDGLPAYLWVPPYACTLANNAITIIGCTGSVGALTIPDWVNGLPVTAIANGAFDNAEGYSLTNVSIGANVTTIGNDAFAACVNLTSITIPNSVTNLGNDAFAFCDNLRNVCFQGNAPTAGASVFFQWSSFPFFPPIYEPPTPTTVYYLPGTTGWGPTLGGAPTVLWNPQAETSNASFGVRANHFGFMITGSSNLTVVVEATTNLVSPNWQPVGTNTLTTGAAYFSDPQGINFSGRFYRFRSP